MTGRESGPTGNRAANKILGGIDPHSTATLRHETVATRLRAVDDALEAVWTALVSGTLRLDQLREMSPHAAAIYLAGFDAGITASTERVRQAEHDADRYYLRAFNPAERAKEIQHRLDRALASCPPTIEPHSPAYFEHALRGVLSGDAA